MLRLRKRERDDRRRALGEAITRENALLESLADLHRRRQDLLNLRGRRRNAGSIRPELEEMERDLLADASRREEILETDLSKTRLEVEKAREALEEARRELERVERLRERRWEEWVSDTARETAFRTDDLVSARNVRDRLEAERVDPSAQSGV